MEYIENSFRLLYNTLTNKNEQTNMEYNSNGYCFIDMLLGLELVSGFEKGHFWTAFKLIKCFGLRIQQTKGFIV